MKYSIRGKGSVSLTQREFISQGGEGKVFGKNNLVYKIYDEPKKKMIPEGKIEELSVLTKPTILNPKDIIIDKNNHPVGFTMDWVKHTIALCKVFTNTFREEHDIKHDVVIELVQNLMETFHFIHSNHCLIVDANEFNFLVDDKKFTVPYFIDVDSYQTTSFPATAIMPSIRDWTNKNFSTLTDWYSFAIISFQLFVGIHPYKGKHPDYKRGDMKSRCIDHLSVLNKEVTIPKTVRDFGHIPTEYLSWYTDLFEKGKRLEPPKTGGTIMAVKTKYIIINSTDNFDIEELKEFSDLIISYRTLFGYSITKTKKEIHLNNKAYPVHKGVDILYAPKSLTPIMVKIKNNSLEMKAITGAIKDPNIQGSEFMIVDNTLYVKNNENLIEFQIFEPPGKDIVLSSKTPVWNIMPNSSELFHGVIYQSILGKAYLTIPIPNEGSLINKHISELEGYRVLDAKYENGVCVLITHKGNIYNRVVLKFDDSFSYDIRITKDIDFAPVNFSVLENGVCVLITDDGTVEVFSNKLSSSTIKTIKDPKIDPEMRLCRDKNKLQFFKGNKLYGIKLK